MGNTIHIKLDMKMVLNDAIFRVNGRAKIRCPLHLIGVRQFFQSFLPFQLANIEEKYDRQIYPKQMTFTRIF